MDYHLLVKVINRSGDHSHIETVTTNELMETFNSLKFGGPISENDFSDKSKKFFLFYDYDNNPIGKASLYYFDNSAYLENMYINKSLQGQGLGKSLLTKIENYAFNNDINKILLIPTPMAHEIKFYEKQAYVPASHISIFSSN